MHSKLESFINDICTLMETKVFVEGWKCSKADLRELLKKERWLEGFREAFNSALLKSFHDSVMDTFDAYNLDKKLTDLDKKGEPPCILTNPGNSKEHFLKEELRSIKIKELEKLQSLVDLQLQEINGIKQRLNFQMSLIKKKEAGIQSLFKRRDEVESIIKQIECLQEIRPTTQMLATIYHLFHTQFAKTKVEFYMYAQCSNEIANNNNDEYLL